MRVVKFTWNQNVNADANYSIQTELVIEDGADPKDIGADLFLFIDEFQNGMKRLTGEA